MAKPVKTAYIGMEIEIHSLYAPHVYKVVELVGDEIRLQSTTNPAKKTKISKADFESGKYS